MACGGSGQSQSSTDCLAIGRNADTLICFRAQLGSNLGEALAALKQTGIRKEYPQLEHRIRELSVDSSSSRITLFAIAFIDYQTGHQIYPTTDFLSASGQYYELQAE